MASERKLHLASRVVVSLVLAGASSITAGCKVAEAEDFTFSSATSAEQEETGGTGGSSSDENRSGSGGKGPGTSANGGKTASSGGAPETAGGSETGGAAGGAPEPSEDGGTGGDAHDGSGGTSSGAPGSGNEPPPPPSEPECAEEARECAEVGSRLLRVCEDGQWVERTCAESEVCDESGPECAPIPPECVGRDPGEKFCDDTTRHVCSADLLSVDSTECDGRCVDGECAPITCGDGHADPGEECDDGNDVATDECTTFCRWATCGDGVVHAPEEECDDGNDRDDDDCLSTCKKPVCGNGKVEGREECDSGNKGATDDCTPECKRPVCGDKYVNGSEQCDDGNKVSGDGCSATCRAEVEAIRVGAYHSCALLSNGDLKCWGDNLMGALGNGSQQSHDRSRPVPTVLSGVSDFSVSSGSSCAGAGGALKCWGDLFGEGNANLVLSPQSIDLGAVPDRLWSGPISYHRCGIFGTNKMKCWGSQSAYEAGALSPTTVSNSRNLPSIPFFEFSYEVLQVATGWDFTCALLNEQGGKVYCWGYNSDGQTGMGSCTYCSYPTPAINLGSSFEAKGVAAGWAHVCAVSKAGQVKCWGDNSSGQLGIGSTDDRGKVPGEMGDALPAVPLGKTAVAVAAGEYFSCALLSDGGVKCWGASFGGQLAQPALTHPDGPGGYANNLGDEPGEVDGLKAIDLGAKAIQIGAGRLFACALLETREVKCWGNNRFLELGIVTSNEAVGDEPGEMGSALQPVRLQ